MLLGVSFLSALVGVGFAGAAAFLPDTGINGTPGAFLALFGAVAVTAALGLLMTVSLPPTARSILFAAAAPGAILTALAAWFLMQNVVAATMVLSVVTLTLDATTAKRKVAG